MSRADRALTVVPRLAGLPGSVRLRREVPAPVAYAVVDVETTGTSIEADEIVSIALVRLDASGEELDRFASLVRPAGPIPPESTAVHGIDDDAVARAPTFAMAAPDVLDLLDGAVFVAHNADFDLPLLQHTFARAGILYRPVGVACTLDAFRLLAPTGGSAARGDLRTARDRLRRRHRCSGDARDDRARSCSARIAPETVSLDDVAYMRLGRAATRGPPRAADQTAVRTGCGWGLVCLTERSCDRS
jgi:DNA polymerase-3 subunit epsilon